MAEIEARKRVDKENKQEDRMTMIKLLEGEIKQAVADYLTKQISKVKVEAGDVSLCLGEGGHAAIVMLQMHFPVPLAEVQKTQGDSEKEDEPTIGEGDVVRLNAVSLNGVPLIGLVVGGCYDEEGNFTYNVEVSGLPGKETRKVLKDIPSSELEKVD